MNSAAFVFKVLSIVCAVICGWSPWIHLPPEAGVQIAALAIIFGTIGNELDDGGHR